MTKMAVSGFSFGGLRFQKGLRVIGNMLMLLIALFMLMPFVWMLSASFKMDTEIFEYPIRWMPKTLRLNNYVKIWIHIDLLSFFLNTVKITLIVCVGQLTTSALAAYSFSKLNYKGRDTLFLIYLATLMVPWHAIMIPQFMVVSKLNLYNSHAALILLGLSSPFGVFVLRQNFLAIPIELNQAAKIDGASELQIFARIILPCAKTGLATLLIFTFMNTWNDYMPPLIYLNDRTLQTIQLGLNYFRTEYSMEYALLMAASVVSTIPMVVLYCFLQKYFVAGVSFSGMKM